MIPSFNEPSHASIPLVDLTAQTSQLESDLIEAARRVFKSGTYILGPEVSAFEKEIAEFLGVRHCIGVNSGTDALVIALRAVGVRPDDEVIAPSFTFFATAEAIGNVGATPRFVDIDPVTFNLDPNLVADAVTERTKAIMPVHLFGQAADMDAILQIAHEKGLLVVEDVAQALGGYHGETRLGALGVASGFSFFPSKNLGAFGDAGLITTDSDEVAEQSRILRAHGAKRKYFNETLGYNSRLDALQASLLRVKLPHVDKWNEQRRRIANRYQELLEDEPHVVLPQEKPYATHVYHQYTVGIRDGKRDHVQAHLAQNKIASFVYYPVPVHRLSPFADSGLALPATERASKEVLSLPIWPEMPSDVQEHVAEVLRAALS